MEDRMATALRVCVCGSWYVQSAHMCTLRIEGRLTATEPHCGLISIQVSKGQVCVCVYMKGRKREAVIYCVCSRSYVHVRTSVCVCILNPTHMQVSHARQL